MNYKPTYLAIAATTIDGRIALNSHHFSNWTSPEDKIFLHTILDTCDLILVGNATYKIAKKPLSKRNCLVFTRSLARKKSSPNLVYFDPAKQSVKKYIKKMKYRRIGILGGAQIYSYCLNHQLLDELYLTLEPISFGRGIAIFENKKTAKWRLNSVKHLNRKGSILFHYTKI
ncbi:MAG: Bifunctional deaminase-reductase protein [uncultured bacterium]|nr:MAG: Bifunctional deaminase-reductase protein [uncultured bacterium]